MMVIACIYLLTECEILLTTYYIYRNGYVSFIFIIFIFKISICTYLRSKKIIKDYNMKDAMPLLNRPRNKIPNKYDHIYIICGGYLG